MVTYRFHLHSETGGSLFVAIPNQKLTSSTLNFLCFLLERREHGVRRYVVRVSSTRHLGGRVVVDEYALGLDWVIRAQVVFKRQMVSIMMNGVPGTLRSIAERHVALCERGNSPNMPSLVVLNPIIVLLILKPKTNTFFVVY